MNTNRLKWPLLKTLEEAGFNSTTVCTPLHSWQTLHRAHNNPIHVGGGDVSAQQQQQKQVLANDLSQRETFWIFNEHNLLGDLCCEYKQFKWKINSIAYHYAREPRVHCACSVVLVSNLIHEAKPHTACHWMPTLCYTIGLLCFTARLAYNKGLVVCDGRKTLQPAGGNSGRLHLLPRCLASDLPQTCCGRESRYSHGIELHT